MEKYFDWSRVIENMDKPIFYIYLPKGYGRKQALNKLYGDKCKEVINIRRQKDDILFH